MKKITLFLLVVVVPLIVGAQCIPVNGVLGQNPIAGSPLWFFLGRIFGILNLVIPIIGALALIWFFWGIIQYVLKGENIEKREQSRDFMIWAVIGMFVMFSIWGLVHIIQNTFFVGLGPGTCLYLQPNEIPSVPVLK